MTSPSGDQPPPSLHFETLQVHSGSKRTDDGNVSDAAIYASTSFVFNDSAHGAAIFGGNAEAFCYSRIANPTTDIFEKRIAALEGGVGALSASSAQAALFMTITSLATAGSEIIIASPISDKSILQFKTQLHRMGISAKFLEGGNLEEIKNSMNENTKAIIVESVSIRELNVTDIASIAEVAHKAGIPLVVDNTAGAGGFLIRPIDHGADIVISSTAEWLSISGSTAAGIIIDSGNFDWNLHKARFPQFTEPSPGFHGLNMWKKFGKLSFIVFARAAVMRDIGPCINPFVSYELLMGLETLSVRMEKVSENALKLASWLQNHESIEKVSYPGLESHPSHQLARKYMVHGYGGLISFSIKPDHFSSQQLKIVTSSGNIGGSKTSIITQTPAINQDFHIEHQPENQPQHANATTTTTTSKTAEGEIVSVFVSVGLEHVDDIIADFKLALA